jgi:hypothetical protein
MDMNMSTNSTPNWDTMRNFVDTHMQKDPPATDVIHDLLAYLGQQMIDLNKAKREKQQEFLDWLTQELQIQPVPDKKGKVGINALKYKDKLLNYPGDYQKGEQALTEEELLAILQHKENQGCYSTLPRPLTKLLPFVRERYMQSLHEVLPLKEKLYLTDWLIDQIVYRLYDLTEEEIAVVEGRMEEKKEVVKEEKREEEELDETWQGGLWIPPPKPTVEEDLFLSLLHFD